MEKRWLFCLFCFLWVPSVTGQSRDVIIQTEVVLALPGTDVTLVCLFPKSHTTHIIQTQWSKTEDSHSAKIAVYHPTYGTHYFKFSEASYNFSVSFSTRKCCSQDVTESLCSTNPNTTSECNQWALHLKNVTITLSGQYKCSFATYPYGTKAAKIQLVVKAEEEQHYLKKVWLNQTLEIPCLEDTTSENLSTYPLKWLVGDNGRKEELVTKEPSCPAVYRNSSAVYGQRIRLALNNTLQIFPTKITDDGRVFSCHVVFHPERVRKSSTTVRVYACCSDVKVSSGLPGKAGSICGVTLPHVCPGDSTWVAGTQNQSMFLEMAEAFGDDFDWQAPRGTNNRAYPEISVSLQEGSAGTSQKPSVSCVVRRAFPKPSLVWYMDRANLSEQPGEIPVVQEDLQDSEGFYQMRSTLMLQGTQETHKTFSCACLFPSLGSEIWNISSEEIFVSFDNKSNEASPETFPTMVSEDLGNSTLTSAVMTASEPQSTSLSSLDFTSQANLAPASITQAGALAFNAETKSYTSATALSESLTAARNLSYSVADQTISAMGGKDFFTTSSLLNSTGDERNTNTSHFPWPTVVAVLLLFCSSLIAVGVRKWCQYQKEIMNRPPSFKPPPPPIKYTSMVDSDGTPPSCHELENL